MSAVWTFKEARPGDRARESQVEKFFNSDAVVDRAEAIVREGIQNSLDAGTESGAIRVRIAIGTWSADETTQRLRRYVEGFDGHINAETVRAKLAEIPSSGDSFRYLVFEDFGTSGLTGDPAVWWPEEHAPPNPFFNYFRAEGLSDKTGTSRGRHGVGRLVFMFASRVRSMFALTRRNEGERSSELLMGTSILRNHRVGNKPFLPDGLFGVPDEQQAGLSLPIRGQDGFITQFKRDFKISRHEETGLSVVVPWLDPEITTDQILRAVLTGYFLPILRRKLVVEVVELGRSERTVDADTLDRHIATLPRFGPAVALARASLDESDLIELPAPDRQNAPKWDASAIPEETQNLIREALDAGRAVATKVLMSVRPKGHPPADTHFKVFIQRDAEAGDGQIHFIREGIIISDVRPRRTAGVRALVVIDDKPLASFLGDAENPSHTQWQKDLVKDSYVYAPAHLEYVVQSVPAILAIVSQGQTKPDVSLLLDLFSVPAEEASATKKKKAESKKSGDETRDQEVELPKTLKRFHVDKLSNGFVVRNGDAGASRPHELSVRVAYGARRGSPFSKYNRADFKLGAAGVKYAVSGGSILEVGDNFLLIEIANDDFEVAVTGFDTGHRDLHVDVRVKESDLDTEQQEANDATPV